jgi:hypothetical protein
MDTKPNHNIILKQIQNASVYAYFFSSFTKKTETLKLYIASGKQYVAKKYVLDETQIVHRVESAKKMPCVKYPPKDYYCCKQEQPHSSEEDYCSVCK